MISATQVRREQPELHSVHTGLETLEVPNIAPERQREQVSEREAKHARSISVFVIGDVANKPEQVCRVQPLLFCHILDCCGMP